jgi:hypothetical protein
VTVATHYVLACYGPDEEDPNTIGEIVNTEVSWQLGARLPQPPPVPVLIDLDPQFPGIMMPMYDCGILVFSKPMVAALESAGVDNLEVFPAILRDPESGAEYRDYFAVNIVGLVAAADLGQSEYEAPSGTPIVDVDFDSLVIDEKRAGDLLMFRLAECITAIIIHERIKQALEAAKIPHLDFLPPEEWIG